MRKRKGYYVCNDDCEECEGRGIVEGSDIARFNTRTMEIYHDTEYVACPNAVEYEPDYDRDSTAKHEECDSYDDE